MDSGSSTKVRSRIRETIVLEKCYNEVARPAIWGSILRLPRNVRQYEILSRQPYHPDVIPVNIRDSHIKRRISRTVSNLIYWHPPLAQCDWIPGLIFPFLVVYERDLHATLETVITVLLNWCHDWILFVPAPPVGVLGRIDTIAKQFGGSAPMSVAWPALRSFFGEMALEDAALILLDNVLSACPSFLEYLVAAYAMMKPPRIVNPANAMMMISRARKMFAEFPPEGGRQFVPLPDGPYPLLATTRGVKKRERDLRRIRREAEEAANADDSAEVREAAAVNARRERYWLEERRILAELEREEAEEALRRERELLATKKAESEARLAALRAQYDEQKEMDQQAEQEFLAERAAFEEEMRRASKVRSDALTEEMDAHERLSLAIQQRVREEAAMRESRAAVRAQAVQDTDALLAQLAETEALLLSRCIHQRHELAQTELALRRGM